jgi:PAS domain S-box-containing protein
MLNQERVLQQIRINDAIFQQAPIGIAISFNSEAQSAEEVETFRINPMYEKITGRSQEELRQVGWASITHPDDVAENLQYYKRFLNGEINGYAMEKRFIRPDRSIVWVHMTVTRLILGDTLKYNHVSLIQDITEQKLLETRLKYDAEHDHWTGLLNRNSLEKLLAQHALVSPPGKRALFGINLNAVQTLTSTYGFYYTQELLKRITSFLSILCTENRILFNTYENRFTFYLTNITEADEVMNFAEEITSILEPVLLAERLNGGLGILEINQENSQDVNQLLKKLLIASEKALTLQDRELAYCIFDENMEAEIEREEQIKQELSCCAADPDCESFYMEYQPIIALKGKKIFGFEALARIRTEVLGFVPPFEFIPIAEKSKQMVEIGQNILIKVFKFLKQLEELGYEEIQIAVNISAIQLLRPNFYQSITGLVEEMQVNPKHIGLEITESVFMSNYLDVNLILKSLLDYGFHIAIDDFGTGYSSLAREQELNISCLKIDKAFVWRLGEIEPEKAILGDIISMAHRMGHCVVAEGVEDEIQLNYLVQHGCDHVQGFLFSKSVSEQEAIKLLQKNDFFMEKQRTSSSKKE